MEVGNQCAIPVTYNSAVRRFLPRSVFVLRSTRRVVVCDLHKDVGSVVVVRCRVGGIGRRDLRIIVVSLALQGSQCTVANARVGDILSVRRAVRDPSGVHVENQALARA